MIIGTPAAGFMPARRHNFSYASALVSLEIPVRGVFPEGSQRAGALYDIYPEEGLVLFGTMLEVLFAYHKYPALNDDQFFAISAIEVEGDVISIVGQALEFVKAAKPESFGG